MPMVAGARLASSNGTLPNPVPLPAPRWGTLQSVLLAGYGIAQVKELGAESLLADGKLVDLFPDWSEERFPLYVLHPSRHRPPAKTRAFVDFVVAITAGRDVRKVAF
jgi:DNA-binding transcriptional LysR family regulator